MVAFGGSLVGFVFGILISLLTRCTKNIQIIEAGFIFILGYLSYLTAEMLSLSSILSLVLRKKTWIWSIPIKGFKQGGLFLLYRIVFCGICCQKYINANMDQNSVNTVRHAMKVFANGSETIIFVFLGISAIDRTIWVWNTGFILLTLLFIFVYRFIGKSLCCVLTFNHDRNFYVKVHRRDFLFVLVFCRHLFPHLDPEQVQARPHWLHRSGDYELRWPTRRRCIRLGGVAGWEQDKGEESDAQHHPHCSLLHCHPSGKEFPFLSWYLPKPIFVLCSLITWYTFLFQGITMKPLVTWLNVKKASVSERTLIEKVQNKVKSHNFRHTTETTVWLSSYCSLYLLLQVFDHMLIAIEDISGQIGHNYMRDKYVFICRICWLSVLNECKTSVSCCEGGISSRRSGWWGFWWSRLWGRTKSRSSTSSMSWTWRTPWVTWQRCWTLCWL